MATSVLPYPTSPQTRRSIGLLEAMSFVMSSMALQLIGRFLILKGGFELMVQHAVVSIGRAVDELAVGIEIDQFVRHFLDIFFDPRGRLGPAGSAQPVQTLGTWPSAPLYRWTWFSRSSGT